MPTQESKSGAYARDNHIGELCRIEIWPECSRQLRLEGGAVGLRNGPVKDVNRVTVSPKPTQRRRRQQLRYLALPRCELIYERGKQYGQTRIPKHDSFGCLVRYVVVANGDRGKHEKREADSCTQETAKLGEQFGLPKNHRHQGTCEKSIGACKRVLTHGPLTNAPEFNQNQSEQGKNKANAQAYLEKLPARSEIDDHGP